MRLLIWMNAIVAFVLVALSVAVYLLASGPGASEIAPDVAQRIAEIDDIERLRRLALLMMRGANGVVRSVNEQVSGGLHVFAGLILALAAVAAVNWVSLLGHRRAR